MGRAQIESSPGIAGASEERECFLEPDWGPFARRSPGLIVRPAGEPEVEERDLAEYDAATGTGTDDGVA